MNIEAVPIDYATVKKTGDVYVITYKAQNGALHAEDVPGDVATAQKVAAVDAKGTVTGKKAGKAVISVKANGKNVKVTVTVKK